MRGQAYRSTAGPEHVKAYKEANDNRGFRGAEEGEGAMRLRMPDEGATSSTTSSAARARSRTCCWTIS